MSSAPDVEIANAPFPVRAKQAAGIINGSRTEVMAMYFADKIMVTVAQEGRLAHWVSSIMLSCIWRWLMYRQLQVPLESVDPNQSDRRLVQDQDGSELLPLSNLNASTLLGLSGSERDTLGQLLATQLASAIVTQRPEEKRVLVVGLGLKSPRLESEDYMELLEVALKCV